MGMTIDEIIAKETEIAQECQKVIDTHMVSEDMSLEEMYCDDTEVIEENLKRCKELLDYHNTIVNTMRKYQQLQADYENRLKADMVAMLTDIQLELDELDSRPGYDGCGMPTFSTDYVRIIKVNEIIQQKIDALKEVVEDGSDTNS